MAEPRDRTVSRRLNMTARKTKNTKANPATVAPSIAPSAIETFLRHLDHTGATGFEGLVTRLMEAETGQRFRIAASGFQAGMDASSEAGADRGNRIKVETKHYFKSGLSLRELTAEIVQAASASDFDLWVLGSTCPVSAQHAVELQNVALERGAECLLLDRPHAGPGRLEVLMARHSELILRFAEECGSTTKGDALELALAEVARHPDFDAVCHQMGAKLRGAALGYEDARLRAAQALRTSLSDPGTAEATFNQRIALHAPETRRIARAGIAASITDWWHRHGLRGSHCAILGEEGRGKSWAALSWSDEGASGHILPLTLAFNASAFPISDGETVATILPQLLAERTGIGDGERWRHRLGRWLEEDAAGPLILLVVDGLNERADIDWVAFFRPLLDQRMRGRIVVVATNRPGHWNPRCARLETDGFQILHIEEYDDRDLAQALNGSGVAITDIPAGMHEMIRTPRYCSLVIEHFAEMRDSDDFTVERLILLDARHRRIAKRGHPISEDDFFEIIAVLARRRRDQVDFSASDLRVLIPGLAADNRVYQELIDGGLLVRRTGGLRPRYCVEPRRLIFGLGMLLAEDASEAASTAGPGDVAEAIAAWLEPHDDIDLKVQICASAAFHAVSDPGYPQTARRELIHCWLRARNRFGDADEARLAFVLKAPSDFVSVAETFWMARSDKGSAQFFLGTAFCRHRDDPRLRPLLVDAVERWSGYIHPAGSPLLRHGNSEHDAQRREAIAARIGGTPTNGPLEVAGRSLTIVADDGLLRLVRLGFLIMSAGDRRPFAGALANWAVAGTVSGGATEADVAAWVVRLAEDDLEPELLAQARALLERGEAVATEAAHLLLNTLGTTAAGKMQAEHPIATPEKVARAQAEHEAAPCMSIYAWSEAECERCIEWPDTPLTTLLERAEGKLLDPERPIPDHVECRLLEAVAGIDPATVHATFVRGPETNQLNDLLPFLAARVPDALFEAIRNAVASIPTRNIEGVHQLALKLPEYYPLFGDRELTVIRAKLADLRRDAEGWRLSESPSDAAQIAECFATWSLLPHLAADDCYAELVGRPLGAFDIDDMASWLTRSSDVVTQDILRTIRTSDDDRLLERSLWLAAHQDATLTNDDRDALVALADAPSAQVRAAALRYACLSGNELLGRQMVALGKRYSDPDAVWDFIWGVELLCRFGADTPFEELAARLGPAAGGFALVARDYPAHEARTYASILNRLWQDATATLSASPPGPVPPDLQLAPGDGRIGSGVASPADDGGTGHSFLSSSASWTSGEEDGPDFAQALTRQHSGPDRADRRRDAAAARSTDAFRWYGHRFHPDALAAAHGAEPAHVERWAQDAANPGPGGRCIRQGLGSFCFDLCVALLRVAPDAGTALFTALREPSGSIRFDAAELLFTAPRSGAVMAAREDLLWQCMTDRSIGRFARAAQASDDDWLTDMITRLVDGTSLSEKARGLALAALSRRTMESFERFVDQANVSGTWVNNRLATLRCYLQRDVLANRWFMRFQDAESEEAAWAALQVSLHLGDGRLERQIAEFRENPGSKSVRIAMIGMIRRSVKQSPNVQRNRDERLFGLKIQKGQIAPFIGKYIVF